MNAQARPRTAPRFIWLGALALAIFTCTSAAAGTDKPDPPEANGYELSLASPTARQAVGADVASPERQKFVEVEVTQVDNPQRIPLSIDMHFQPPQGEQVYLGSFALYPPDNPGKFIVATRGELRTDGVVSVTLVPLERPGEAPIRVRLARLTFAEK